MSHIRRVEHARAHIARAVLEATVRWYLTSEEQDEIFRSLQLEQRRIRAVLEDARSAPAQGATPTE